MIRVKTNTWKAEQDTNPLSGMESLNVVHQPWREQASCAQVGTGDMWFPAKGGDEFSQPAKAVCRSCPVQAECLEYALTNGESFGIWGGVSPKERSKIIRQRSGSIEKYAYMCQQCGTAFRSNSKVSKFCSQKCVYRAYQNRKQAAA